MLHQPTIEKLISMCLQGMVDGLEALEPVLQIRIKNSG
jgi:hypothetical protein